MNLDFPCRQHAIPTLDSLTFVRHLAKKWIDLIMGSLLEAITYVTSIWKLTSYGGPRSENKLNLTEPVK